MMRQRLTALTGSFISTGFRAACLVAILPIMAGCLNSGTMWNNAAITEEVPVDAGDDGAEGGDPAILADDSVPFPAELNFASPTSARTDGVSDEAQEFSETISTLLDPDSLEDCAVNFSLNFQVTNASCYGPRLNYSNHPDAAVGQPDDGMLPPGDTGIMLTTNGSTQESCAAAQMDALMAGVGSFSEGAIETVASLYCIARVNDLTIPSQAGERLDLSAETEAAFAENGINFQVDQAVIKREEVDNARGPAFTIALIGSTTDDQGVERDIFVRLRHVPYSAGNDTYAGKISYYAAVHSNDKPGNCNAGVETGKVNAVSISYEKSSSTQMNKEVRFTELCGTTADPFEDVDNYTVDPDNKFNAQTNPFGWANSFNHTLFAENLQNGSGDYRYSWQAGMFDNNTRVMNGFLDADLNGAFWFGYGPDITVNLAGDIDRMICNWVGPGNNHTGIPFAQQQEVSFSEALGVFVPVTSNITYAPTNSCNTTGFNAQAQPFSYGTEDLSINVVGTPVNHNLVPVSEIGMNAFTVPYDVDE